MILLLNTVQLNTKYGIEMNRRWKIANKFSYIYSFLFFFFHFNHFSICIFSSSSSCVPCNPERTTQDPLQVHQEQRTNSFCGSTLTIYQCWEQCCSPDRTLHKGYTEESPGERKEHFCVLTKITEEWEEVGDYFRLIIKKRFCGLRFWFSKK